MENLLKTTFSLIKNDFTKFTDSINYKDFRIYSKGKLKFKPQSITSGINVKKHKMLAFVLSAMFAGGAGAVYAHLPPGYIHPNNYTVIEMVTFLAMVVFGGLGHIWGGIIGAIIITIVYDLTRPLYEYQLFIFLIIYL